MTKYLQTPKLAQSHLCKSAESWLGNSQALHRLFLEVLDNFFLSFLLENENVKKSFKNVKKTFKTVQNIAETLGQLSMTEDPCN